MRNPVLVISLVMALSACGKSRFGGGGGSKDSKETDANPNIEHNNGPKDNDASGGPPAGNIIAGQGNLKLDKVFSDTYLTGENMYNQTLWGTSYHAAGEVVSCRTGTVPLAGVAACSSNSNVPGATGSLACFGSFLLCGIPALPGGSVVTKIAVAPACAAGFQQAGQFVVINSPTSVETLRICKQLTPIQELQAGAKAVSGLSFTPTGAHVLNPQCPAGSEVVGNFSDCGNSSATPHQYYCLGRQLACAKMESL